jgi:hemoglobin-like flavoprotein
MTPHQIDLVETTLASVDVATLASDFYQRALQRDPTLTSMFASPPEVQQRRFAAELTEIVRSIRTMESFTTRTKALGVWHDGRGVQAVHYRFMGEVLLESLATVVGDDWSDEAATAWGLAYHLTAEAMMSGALQSRCSD